MASVQDVEVQDQVPLCQEEGTAVKAKRSRAGVFAGVAVALALCGAAAVGFFSARGREETVSVRALLESDELADLATNNLMAMGQKYFAPSDRADVHSHVTGRFQQIKERLQAEHPEDFKRLGDIKITKPQKQFVKKVLGSYGDARVLAFTDTVRDAVRETVRTKGDHESLKRRLSEKLAPHAAGLKDMVEELFPGHGASFDLDAAQRPVVEGFASLEAVFDSEPSAPRRLSDEEVLDAVSAHAHTLFETLEHMLGNEMPSAPTRMLGTYSSGYNDAPVGGAPPTEEQKQSFISCCMKAFPNPITICGCVAKNISSFMSMIMSFVGGGKNK